MAGVNDKGEKTVQVKRDGLLKVVRENLAKHLTDYEEACVGYRQKTVEAVLKAQVQLNLARERFLQAKGTDLPALDFTHPAIAAPASHERDYRRLVQMLEMEQRELLELTPEDFAKYVCDDWQWKQQFESTNAFYKSR